MKGRFAGYLCACYDNTVRRAMESALKESEARYQGMTANVPGMVFELLRDPRRQALVFLCQRRRRGADRRQPKRR